MGIICLLGAKGLKNVPYIQEIPVEMHHRASFSFINHPLFPILMLLRILAEPMCSEGCGMSISGQAPPHLDGVIPSMADGSKFFPSHNPSVGQNSGSFVAIMICVTKLQNDCLLPNQDSH